VTASQPQSQAPPRRLLKRLAWRIGIALAMLAAIRWTHLAESLTVYFPSRAPFVTPAGAEDVTFTTRDGVSLHGWFVRATDAQPGEKRPAILHTHGNAGNIADHLAFSSHLADAGFHVFIFDYRGYGKSDPCRLITRDDLITDTHAALDTLVAREDVDRENIGVYGVSLGGVPALAVASQRPVIKAVCTVSAFASFPRIAHDVLPVLGPLLMPTGDSNLDAAESLRVPYLIVHGESDEIIPASHATMLEQAAADSGVSVRRTMIPGGDHNGIMDHAAARDATIAFFQQHLLRAP
jgi:dipeptidyl aminopeptidase/acylaminoacyl peptidase